MTAKEKPSTASRSDSSGEGTVARITLRVKSLIEKGTGKLNEDAMLLGTNRFGVFDGATSLDGYTNTEGFTGGYLASHSLCKTFEQSKETLRETTKKANTNLHLAMRNEGIDLTRKESLWCSTLAVVDINPTKKEFEWIQVADALILLINTDSTYRMLIDGYEHDEEIRMHWKELADKGETNIRAKLTSEIIHNRQKANVDYGVMNGEEVALDFVRSGRESLEGVAHVLLFTDGLILPKTDPRVPDDFSLLTRLFLEGGLIRVKEHVRAIEESDPDCRKYPRYKKSDDIATVAITIS